MMRKKHQSNNKPSPYLPHAHPGDWEGWEHVVRFLKPSPFLYRAHTLNLPGIDEVHIIHCLGTPAGGLRSPEDRRADPDGLDDCRSILVKGNSVHLADSGGQTHARFALWHYGAMRALILTCRVSSTLFRGLTDLSTGVGPIDGYDILLSTSPTEVADGYRYRVRQAEGDRGFDPVRANESWRRDCERDLGWCRDRVIQSIKKWLNRNNIKDALHIART